MSEKLRELRAFVEKRLCEINAKGENTQIWEYRKMCNDEARGIATILAEIDRLLAPEGERKCSYCGKSGGCQCLECECDSDEY